MKLMKTKVNSIRTKNPVMLIYEFYRNWRESCIIFGKSRNFSFWFSKFKKFCRSVFTKPEIFYQEIGKFCMEMREMLWRKSWKCGRCERHWKMREKSPKCRILPCNAGELTVRRQSQISSFRVLAWSQKWVGRSVVKTFGFSFPTSILWFSKKHSTTSQPKHNTTVAWLRVKGGFKLWPSEYLGFQHKMAHIKW